MEKVNEQQDMSERMMERAEYLSWYMEVYQSRPVAFDGSSDYLAFVSGLRRGKVRAALSAPTTTGVSALVEALEAVETLFAPYAKDSTQKDWLDKARDALSAQPSAPEQVSMPVGLLQALVANIEDRTCTHDSTHRGGTIWEICDDCGDRWADDMGGKPEFKWPDCVEKARALLASSEQEVEP